MKAFKKWLLFPLRIIQWLVYLPIHILVFLLRFPLAYIAVKLFSTADRKYLKFPFRWLETIDNDLSGDAGWRNEHIDKGSDPLSDSNRIAWLHRNGGNRFNYYVLGCKAIDNSVDAKNSFHKSFIIRDDGYWMLSTAKFFWGWSLLGPQHNQCKFTFSTRPFRTTKK